jgi:PII-like signaling protein
MSTDALKLTTYFSERSRLDGRLLADELLDIHAHHEIRASVLLRGAQGFGAKHRLRTDRLLTLSEDLPLVSVALDTSERIEALLQAVGAIGDGGLLTLEHTRIDGGLVQPGEVLPSAGEVVELTIFIGRHEQVDGEPAFMAVCRVLHEIGVAGATVLLGVDGTRDGRRRRARFFAGNANVPMMVIAVGEAPCIGEAIGRLTQLLSAPLFAVDHVSLCKRDGRLVHPPDSASVPEEHGMAMMQKLTVVVSEAARHEGKPVHLELVQRLRGAQAAGATSVRGIWGFHGEHPPHGDRLLSFRRHVPVLTDIIDTPERIAALFPIVDELTSERGLVTCETVLTSAPSL